MKKNNLIVAIIILLGISLFILSGCENNDNERMTSDWKHTFADKHESITDETFDIFEKAKENYTTMELDAIALLGEQVVAGENYMFLAKGYQKGDQENATYKTVTIYNDFENKATITNVKDFDYTKYVNENLDNNKEILTGGWYVNPKIKEVELEEKVQKAFDNAASTLTGITFKPIAVLGEQKASGTNYAILCYGGASYESSKLGVYIITLYEDLRGTQEIISHAYVNLSDYNK